MTADGAEAYEPDDRIPYVERAMATLPLPPPLAEAEQCDIAA